MNTYNNHTRSTRRRGFTLIELLVVIAIFAILVTCLFGGCNQGSGSHVGTINNVSRQGIICKTYEGVMQVGGGVVGTAASVWKFGSGLFCNF